MQKHSVMSTQETLCQYARDAVKLAQALGASACEIVYAETSGQDVNVRLGHVDTIEHSQDKSFGITSYVGKQKGHASSSDLSPKSIEECIRASLSIARVTAHDDCSGLADPDRLARTPKDLDLEHPINMSTDDAIEHAKIIEALAMDQDHRINNSEGASVSLHRGHYVYANSHDFLSYQKSTRYSHSVSLVAEDHSGMQRDYWYDTARCFEDLCSKDILANTAAHRTLRRLGARPITTGNYPVIFEASVASSLIGSLVSACSGGNLYRKSSFLIDALDTNILPSFAQIEEKPWILRGLASRWCDEEGVETVERTWINQGILTGYFLSSYSARKLGMSSTGHAGGIHNIRVTPNLGSLNEMVKAMGRGLIITELMGQGVNMVTGDYSRGASGFWVEDGVIVHPVEEITIAGHLGNMMRSCLGFGSDLLVRGSIGCGSIWIESMMVAGQGD
jgi:PmbA protein